MKSDEEIFNTVVIPIYRELFKEATPSADFNKLMETGETKKEKFFMKYYLDEKRQEDIIDYHIKKAKLNKSEANKVRTTVYLGCSPTSVLKLKEKIDDKDNL